MEQIIQEISKLPDTTIALLIALIAMLAFLGIVWKSNLLQRTGKASNGSSQPDDTQTQLGAFRAMTEMATLLTKSLAEPLKGISLSQERTSAQLDNVAKVLEPLALAVPELRQVVINTSKMMETVQETTVTTSKIKVELGKVKESMDRLSGQDETLQKLLEQQNEALEILRRIESKLGTHKLCQEDRELLTGTKEVLDDIASKLDDIQAKAGKEDK